MHTRVLALALLAFGLACQTSRTASSTEPSRAPESPSTSTASGPASPGDTGTMPSDPTATSSGGTASGSTSSGTSSATTPGSTSPDASSTGGTSGSTASSDRATTSSDASSVGGHSDDKEISGRVKEIDSDWVAIETDHEGERRLRIVEQTVVTLDGADASPSELEEGQEVRATYNEDDQGRPTAVVITDAP
jgi:hypothetical protein